MSKGSAADVYEPEPKNERAGKVKETEYVILKAYTNQDQQDAGLDKIEDLKELGWEVSKQLGKNCYEMRMPKAEHDAMVKRGHELDKLQRRAPKTGSVKDEHPNSTAIVAKAEETPVSGEQILAEFPGAKALIQGED